VKRRRDIGREKYRKKLKRNKQIVHCKEEDKKEK